MRGLRAAAHLFPAAVVDGQAVGATVEVVHAEEVIELNDAVNFCVRPAIRVDRLPDALPLTLVVELWFIERERMLGSGASVHAAFRCVSRRRLALLLRPADGLHCHRPVLFDFYHLAAVSLTLHASLTGCESRWKNKPSAAESSESAGVSVKLRAYHSATCSLMLDAIDTLQGRLAFYSRLLRTSCQILLARLDAAAKLEALSDRLLVEPEPFAALEQDRLLLSQELSVLWRQFVELCRGQAPVRDYLASQHDALRTRRLMEGCLSTSHPLAALNATDSTNLIKVYSRVTSALRRSAYFSSMPPLPLFCADLDGAVETATVLFEDIFCRADWTEPATTAPSRSSTVPNLAHSRTDSDAPPESATPYISANSGGKGDNSLPASELSDDGALPAEISPPMLAFIHNREFFKTRLADFGFVGHLARNDQLQLGRAAAAATGATHLIVCVHGLDGSAADLRAYRTLLKLHLASSNVHFFMSEANQGHTFCDMQTVTRNLVDELLTHLATMPRPPDRLSFVAHSLGALAVRAALADPRLSVVLDRLHTFLSLNGPHCGLLFTARAANIGLSLLRWWKRSGTIAQLTLSDQTNPRDSFVYRLSKECGLRLFKNVLLVGSDQDLYVPCHSALILPTAAATGDQSELGKCYTEMVENLLKPLIREGRTRLVRFTAFHGLSGAARSHQVLGRAAHVAVLDDDVFVEKLLRFAAMRHFR